MCEKLNFRPSTRLSCASTPSRLPDRSGNLEEFKGHVGDLNVQGIDLITLNDRGELQNLDVMIRPMNALESLRDIIAPQMMEFLRG